MYKLPGKKNKNIVQHKIRLLLRQSSCYDFHNPKNKGTDQTADAKAGLLLCCSHAIKIRVSCDGHKAKKKLLGFRVTRPYLNLLVNPRIFFRFSGKKYNFMHFDRRNAFQNA